MTQYLFSLTLCVLVASLRAATLPTTTTPAPPSTTECSVTCIYPKVKINNQCRCDCAFSPGANTNQYLQPVAGHGLLTMSCAATLVWNQEMCQCTYDTAPAADTGSAATTTAPKLCDTIINYALHPSSGEYSGGDSFVNIVNSVNQIPVVVAILATEGKAADLTNNAIELPYFKGNDLTNTATIQLRFKPNKSSQNESMVVLSNGCTIAAKSEESLRLAYNQVNQTLDFKVMTDAADSTGRCHNITSADDWYKVTLSVKDSVTEVYVNDVLCGAMQGQGEIASTNCDLTVGRDPLMLATGVDFQGLIDYVTVTKHCSVDELTTTAAPTTSTTTTAPTTTAQATGPSENTEQGPSGPSDPATQTGPTGNMPA